jgi:energy-coupling factor transporter ATP-binding protein EcfA2
VADAEKISSGAPKEGESERFGLKLSSVELDKWPPIGPGKITLDLADRRTVLIGRNGAGKSTLIDGILLGLNDSVRGPRLGPRYFRARFEDTEGRSIVYEHAWEPASDESSSSPSSLERRRAGQKWSQRCWYEGREDSPIWRMQDGVAHLGERGVGVPENGSVPLSVLLMGPNSVDPGDYLRCGGFVDFCLSAKRVDAGIPHAKEPGPGPRERTDSVFFHRAKKNLDLAEGDAPQWTILGDMPKRFTQVFSAIFDWSRMDAETGDFNELTELGKKIGAFRKFEIPIVEAPDGQSFAMVMVDGVNAGSAPDGTLRLIEILYAMLAIRSRSILLLEEPETGVHPAALVSLLNVLESYSADRQVLISSHSPVVIRQVNPEELRIVYRRENRTYVRALDASELDRAAAFLSQDGTLDEFLGSGAIDES